MNTGSDKGTRITALSVQAMIHAVEAFVNCDASHDECVIWTRHAKIGLSMRFLKGMTRVTRKIAPLRTGHETTFWDVASVIPYGKTLHLHSVGYGACRRTAWQKCCISI